MSFARWFVSCPMTARSLYAVFSASSELYLDNWLSLMYFWTPLRARLCKIWRPPDFISRLSTILRKCFASFQRGAFLKSLQLYFKRCGPELAFNVNNCKDEQTSSAESLKAVRGSILVMLDSGYICCQAGTSLEQKQFPEGFKMWFGRHLAWFGIMFGIMFSNLRCIVFDVGRV